MSDIEYPEFIKRSDAAKKAAKIISNLTYNKDNLRGYSESEWKKIIRERIRDRINDSRIPVMDDGTVSFAAIVDTFRPKYGKKLAAIPTTPITISAVLVGGGFRTIFSGTGYLMPNTLDKCHEHIRELSHRCFGMANEVARLQAEIDDLKPDAERWRNKKVNSGRRGKQL